jgi:protein subunit release factor A
MRPQGHVGSSPTLSAIPFMMTRHTVFRVTKADCRRDTFTCGGKGGSGKDTSNNGVRYVHEPSGAVGECREERYQHQNDKIAWERMAKHAKFQAWARLEVARIQSGKTVEQKVDESLAPEFLKYEARDDDGHWYETTVDKLSDDVR